MTERAKTVLSRVVAAVTGGGLVSLLRTRTIVALILLLLALVAGIERDAVRGATWNHRCWTDACHADRRNRPFGRERGDRLGLPHGYSYRAGSRAGDTLWTRSWICRRPDQRDRRCASSRTTFGNDLGNRVDDGGDAGRLQPEKDGRRATCAAIH